MISPGRTFFSFTLRFPSAREGRYPAKNEMKGGVIMKVIQHGLGFIGQKALHMMLRKGIEVVGAVDQNREYLGKDLGEILGIGRKLNVTATDDISALLKKTRADVVANATVTYLDKVAPELGMFLDAGINVASISEELCYPWIRFPNAAKELDERAKRKNVTIVGTGVNPGLDMDLMPIMYAGACWNVEKIRVQRTVDASVYSPTRATKRYGISPAEFKKGVREKTIPLHSGLYESLTMISDAMGWKLDQITETWEPMLSRSTRTSQWFTIQPGTICGFKQTAVGSIAGEAKVILDIYFMAMPILEEDGVSAGDMIWIDGEPNLAIKVNGGSTERGDLVTSAKLVNVLPAVIAARPGLLSVKDLPATPPLPDRVEARS
jgi:hypothetical protein